MAGDRPLLLGGVSAAGVGAVLVVVGLALTAGSRDGEDVPAPIGIADQVAFLAQDLQQDTALFLFDRRFRFLTSTDLSQYGAVTPWQWAPLSSQGYSVPMDPLNVRFLAGISFSGTVSYVSDVPDNPVAAATDTQGSTYVLTRVGLAGPGPAYKFDSTGTLVGTFLAPVQLWQGGYAWDVEVDSQGDVILAGTDVAISRGRIAKLDSNGNILWDIVPSPPGSGSTGVISSIALDRQDNIWAIHRGFGSPGGTHLSLFDGQDGQILLDHPLSSGGLALSGALSLDRWGRLYTIGGGGSSIHQFDPLTGNLLQTFTIPGYGVPGSFTGIPFDPRGEEIWTVTVLSVSPVRMALVKVAVATGQTSLLNLSSVWLGGPADMPQTDPMGFLWANIVDPTGDADGDGAGNRAEIDGGSNPYDAGSRPGGPTVYVMFDAANVMTLRYVDPDGVFGPKGLSLPSFWLFLDDVQTNHFWLLLGAVTQVTLSPDGTQLDLVLGAVTLPSVLKVEAGVIDKDGNQAWDVHITP